MNQYKVTLSGETYPNEKLGQRCAFVISLSFHQAETLQTNDLSKFTTTVERLNSAFDDIDVILSDSLNRHNASIYYPHSDPKKKALVLGDTWLASFYHQEVIKLKNSRSPIIRWTQLILEKNYSDVLKIVETLYKKNLEFSTTVDSVCAKFVAFLCDKRKKAIENRSIITNKSTDIDLTFSVEKAYKICLIYVLEESAVTLMFRLIGYTNLFHIGKVNDAVSWVATHAISYQDEDDCDKALIDTINANPLIVTIPLKYTVEQASVINVTPENRFKTKDFSSQSTKTIFFNQSSLTHQNNKSIDQASNDAQNGSSTIKSCH